MCENYYPQIVDCICLIQLIFWDFLIVEPEKKKHERVIWFLIFVTHTDLNNLFPLLEN